MSTRMLFAIIVGGLVAVGAVFQRVQNTFATKILANLQAQWDGEVTPGSLLSSPTLVCVKDQVKLTAGFSSGGGRTAERAGSSTFALAEWGTDHAARLSVRSKGGQAWGETVMDKLSGGAIGGSPVATGDRDFDARFTVMANEHGKGLVQRLLTHERRAELAALGDVGNVYAALQPVEPSTRSTRVLVSVTTSSPDAKTVEAVLRCASAMGIAMRDASDK